MSHSGGLGWLWYGKQTAIKSSFPRRKIRAYTTCRTDQMQHFMHGVAAFIITPSRKSLNHWLDEMSGSHQRRNPPGLSTPSSYKSSERRKRNLVTVLMPMMTGDVS